MVARAVFPSVTGLIDLTGIPLADLRSEDKNDALDEAIQRVTAAAEGEAEELICKFNSGI